MVLLEEMSDMMDEISRNRTNLLPLDRLVFLIDGVFAITLTLLILDLKLPEDAGSSLGLAMKDMLPRLAIYLFAFSTIVNHWAVHHRTFRYVQRADNALVLLSFTNLLLITLIPVSAGIVGNYPLQTLAAAVFAVNSLFLCLSAAAVWAYVAAHSQLLAEDTDTRVLKGISTVWLLVGLGFAISLAVGQLTISGQYLIWLLWPWVVPAWWTRRQSGELRRKVNSGPREES